MKKLLFLLLTVVAAGTLSAQGNSLNPVSWTFSSKKISDNVYELQMTATIQAGWHLYSQAQPQDAIAQPTAFSFTKNPLLILDGKVKEIGKMQKYKDEQLGVTANQYSDRVVFTQKVKLKGKAKTNVVGNVEFQTCDDSKCLPPKTINFNIALK